MKRMRDIAKRFLLWIGAAVMLLAAGCAKAPVKEVAAKKHTEKIVEIASTDGKQAEDRLRDKLGAPISYNSGVSISDKRMHVSVAAQVVIPASEQISIYSVSAADFSQELAQRAYQHFCGDTIMYPISGRLTRDWYASEIARIQKELAENDLKASDRQSKEGYLALLEEGMQTAPESSGESIEHVRLDVREADDGGRYACFEAIENVAPQPGKHFSVLNNTTYATGGMADGVKTIALRSDAILEYHDTSVYQGDFSNVREISEHEQAENSSLSPSEAKAQAQKVLDDLGLADMFIESIYTVDNAVEAEATGMDTRYAYCVTAYRTVSQIPVRSAGYASYVGSLEDGHEWIYERILIGVNDQGVFHFSWRAPLSVGNIQVADSNLLAFDEILKVFRATIETVYSTTIQALGGDATLLMSVYRIELSLQRISNQGSVTDGILCPVWSFWGKTQLAYASGAVADWSGSPIETNDLLYPLLSINAVDGSIIIANEGY